MFHGLTMEAGEKIEFYYRSIVYFDQFEQKQLKNKYGEDVLTVRIGKLSEWAFMTPYNIIDGGDV